MPPCELFMAQGCNSSAHHLTQQCSSCRHIKGEVSVPVEVSSTNNHHTSLIVSALQRDSLTEHISFAFPTAIPYISRPCTKTLRRCIPPLPPQPSPCYPFSPSPSLPTSPSPSAPTTNSPSTPQSSPRLQATPSPSPTSPRTTPSSNPASPTPAILSLVASSPASSP